MECHDIETMQREAVKSIIKAPDKLNIFYTGSIITA